MSKRILSLKVAGPGPGSKGTLFFLPGFPDRHNSFMDSLVPELSKEYTCVVACLPDYDQPHLSKFFGYGRKDIVEMIDHTIAEVIPDGPVTLILHDWGSFYGMSWYAQNKSRVSRLVCLDVFVLDGIQMTREKPPSEIFFLLLYQWWLALAFLAGRIFPLMGNLTMLSLKLSKLGPDLKPPRRALICPPTGPRWFMCYPYFHFWLEKLLRQNPPAISEEDLCPVLYAYGNKKRVMFHSGKQITRMSKNPRHKVIEYDCGHWIQHAQTSQLVGEIRDFLSSK